MVWGAERPELLITETLAFHDRRTEDRFSPDTNGHNDFASSSSGHYFDKDLDQSLRRGVAVRRALQSELGRWTIAERAVSLCSRNLPRIDPVSGNPDVNLPTGQPVVPAQKQSDRLPYTDPLTGKTEDGVLLDRLSDFGVDANGNLTKNTAANGSIKRSPVWRMIVVEEDPVYRSLEYTYDGAAGSATATADPLKKWRRPVDAQGKPYDWDSDSQIKFGPKLPLAAQTGTQGQDQVGPRDEWQTIVQGKTIEWNLSQVNRTQPQIAADSDLAQKCYRNAVTNMKAWQPKKLDLTANTNPFPLFRPTNPDFVESFDFGSRPVQETTQNYFDVRYPNIEREIYFTTDNSPTRDVGNANFRLRIPDRSFKAGQPAPFDHQNWGDKRTGVTGSFWQTQRFIAPITPTGTADQTIAPILPGRYSVVGSAGNKYPKKYDGSNEVSSIANYFVTAIGREPRDHPNTEDAEFQPDRVRRIELRPSLNPNLNQLLVTANGGYDPNNQPAP